LKFTMNKRASRANGIAGRALRVAGVCGLALALGGCETDSFLMDPSVIGRWEHTPTRVPILTRIASIEGPADDFVDVSDVRPEDLIPEVNEYRVGPGDRMTVQVYDIPEEGKMLPYEVVVDTRGYISIPQVGEVEVAGRTSRDAEQAIMNAMKELVANPLAAVKVDTQRQQRFSIFGGVQNSGQYAIPAADYRILEGLTAAGGWSEAPEFIYVIRQIPLTERAGAGQNRPKKPEMTPKDLNKAPSDLNKIIDDLATPKSESKPAQPEKKPEAPKPPTGSPGMMRPQPEAQKPAIDLIDPKAPVQPAAPAAPAASADRSDGSWVFLNGQWVKVSRPGATVSGGAAEAMGQRAGTSESLVSQRVIRVPTQKLANGDARYNIVIRPGDVIRVPPAPSGTVYIGGQISRAGSYNMQDRLTLTSAIIAAGGLSQTAVPERVDIRRIVGTDMQGIVRVNLRAIHEGTHPDIYLRANDQINIGTNFWATPLAILRNGFRISYGFGFLVDRNFGTDIFGVPKGGVGNGN